MSRATHLVAQSSRVRWLVLPGSVLLLTSFVIPLAVILKVTLFGEASATQLFSRLFASPIYLGVLGNTVKTATIVATLSLVLGYPVAFFVSQQPPHRRAILVFLILVPFWVSVLVRTYAWMIVLGRDGIINAFLIWTGAINAPLKLSFSSVAVYIVMVQILLPFMIMTCYSTMAEIDGTYLRAARVLGARATTAFVRVFLPLSLEGATTGFVLVFMLSMGFFIVPALIGAPSDVMIANLISDQVDKANWELAAVLAVVLLVVTLGIMGIVRLATRRLVFHFSVEA